MKTILCILLPLLGIGVLGHPPLQLETEERFKGGPPPDRTLPQLSLPTVNLEEGLYRLPTTTIPLHYEIFLDVWMADGADEAKHFTVDGTTTISFNVTEATTNVVLHANHAFINLNDSVIEISPGGGPWVAATFRMSVNDDHFLTIESPTPLNQNQIHQLRITGFKAPVALDRTNGLYRTNYTNPTDGTVHHVAATQMESIHLRQLMPSFDEPNLKAIFSVSIKHNCIYNTVLCNGVEVERTPPDNGRCTTSFSETKPMAPYLFAMTIAEYAYANASDSTWPDESTRIPVKVFAAPHVVEGGGSQYPADITSKLLFFFDEYFGFHYPFEKLDSVALTHKGGAMENWGLILYRWDLLTYFQGQTLETAKNSLVSVISHEVAHQNFGNLVTCKWWSDLWINEGFATFLSYVGVDNIGIPEFKHMEWFVNDAVQPAMAYDVGPNSHPLRNSAESPQEIDAIFSAITYDKGASIIRMVQAFLGPNIFLQGLKDFLNEMQYQPVDQDELFRHWDAVADSATLPAGTTVKTVLDSWTLHKSHPLVRVSVTDNSNVSISQERYADPSSSERWYIPITYVEESEPSITKKLWLRKNESITKISHDNSKWIMLNPDAIGFYRVLYDAELTSLIRDQLMRDHTVISDLSRSQLLDDYLNLAFRGIVPMETALSLTEYLEKEEHFTVWQVVFNQFNNVLKFTENPEDFGKFTAFLLPKLSEALNRVGGFTQNPELHKGALEIFRMKLIDWSCSMGLNECTEHATDLWNEWKATNQNPIHPDIQGPMMCNIVAKGGVEGFNFILTKYNESVEGSLFDTRLLNSLACSEDESLLQGLLDKILTPPSPGDIKQSHIITTILRVAMNPKGRLLVLQFLEEKMPVIIQLAHIGHGRIGVALDILRGINGQLSTQQQLDKLLLVLHGHSDLLQSGITDAQLNDVRNAVRTNVNWMMQWGTPILNWMSENTSQPPSPPTSTTTTTTETATETTTSTSANNFSFSSALIVSFTIVAYFLA